MAFGILLVLVGALVLMGALRLFKSSLLGIIGFLVFIIGIVLHVLETGVIPFLG